MFYHILGISTIESNGISVYIYINTYTNTDFNKAKVHVESMNGTIFLVKSLLSKEQFRQLEEFGNVDVDMYTKKNGWRPKKISIRPLV